MKIKDNNSALEFAFCRPEHSLRLHCTSSPYRYLSVVATGARHDVACLSGAHGADGVVVTVKLLLGVVRQGVYDENFTVFGSSPNL